MNGALAPHENARPVDRRAGRAAPAQMEGQVFIGDDISSPTNSGTKTLLHAVDRMASAAHGLASVFSTERP